MRRGRGVERCDGQLDWRGLRRYGSAHHIVGPLHYHRDRDLRLFLRRNRGVDCRGSHLD
jgi:hypothetical protein